MSYSQWLAHTQSEQPAPGQRCTCENVVLHHFEPNHQKVQEALPSLCGRRLGVLRHFVTSVCVINIPTISGSLSISTQVQHYPPRSAEKICTPASPRSSRIPCLAPVVHTYPSVASILLPPRNCPVSTGTHTFQGGRSDHPFIEQGSPSRYGCSWPGLRIASVCRPLIGRQFPGLLRLQGRKGCLWESLNKRFWSVCSRAAGVFKCSPRRERGG